MKTNQPTRAGVAFVRKSGAVMYAMPLNADAEILPGHAPNGDRLVGCTQAVIDLARKMADCEKETRASFLVEIDGLLCTKLELVKQRMRDTWPQELKDAWTAASRNLLDALEDETCKQSD